jgi:hypothetical protein
MSARRTPSGWSPHPIRQRAVFAWLLVAADLMAALLAQSYDAIPLASVVLVAVIASFAIVGAIPVTRVAGNPIGWILWTSGSLIGPVDRGEYLRELQPRTT